MLVLLVAGAKPLAVKVGRYLSGFLITRVKSTPFSTRIIEVFESDKHIAASEITVLITFKVL
jgi:hypothetical protein